MSKGRIPKRKCFECKTARAGRLDEDGTFYCNACWERYESSGAVVSAAAASVIPSPVNHSAAQTKPVQTSGRDQQKIAPKDDAKPVAVGAKKVNPPGEAEDRPGDSLPLQLPEIDQILGLSYIKTLEEESETLRQELRLADEELVEVAKQERRIVRGETVELGNVRDSTIQLLLTNLATKHNDLHRPSAAMSDAEKALEGADQRVGIMLEKVKDAAAAVELSQTRAVGATQESIDRAKADLDRAKADLRDAKADLRDAKADLDRAKADAKADLDRAKADLDRAKADLRDAKTDLRDVKAQLVGQLETTEKKLSDRRSFVSEVFAKPTSSESSKKPTESLENEVCDVCGGRNNLTRAHIVSSEVCNVRNKIVLCGTKGRTGTCHHNYDSHLMGIMCVDPHGAGESSGSSSQSRRTWFSFDLAGNVRELKQFQSRPTRQLVNIRAQLLLEKLSPQAQQNIANVICMFTPPQDRKRAIWSWLQTTETPPRR